MEPAIERFYKISQCSSDLKESLSNTSLNEQDFNNLIERHIAASYNENLPVCDFIEGADWLNVPEPLSLHIHLRSKVVILDFWTYCCINCLHMLPELKKLEETYSPTDGVIFVGVHSAKFDHEKDTVNLQNAVLRHNVTHPVINDHGAMWSALGITCWPTLLVLGPNCRPLYIQIGEGGFDILGKYIKMCLKYFDSELDRADVKFHQSTQGNVSAALNNLSYPSKVASFKGKDCTLLVVSDSANNRIIVIVNGTEVLKIIGCGKRGYKDGDVGTAQFANPQGVVFYNENIIFVADCENHCIRKVDLLQNKVFTVAGDKNGAGNKNADGESVDVSMRSPWGLALYKGYDLADDMLEIKNKKYILFIAMAGTHQIWALFLDSCTWWKNKSYAAGTCTVISGTGKEENRNNSYPMSAAFAQPSGLAINYTDNEMYVADSESSTVRRISLKNGKVSPIVGGEKDPFNLFAYGDVDGTLTDAKLKHPLDVAWSERRSCLFVADTFNDKIKMIDVKTNTVLSLWNSENMNLKEPGGLCLLPDEEFLIVADTNNNRLQCVNIKNGTNNSMTLNFEKSRKKIDLPKNFMTPDSIFQKHVFIPNLSQVCFSVRFIESSIKLNKDVKQNWKVRVDNNKNIIKKREVNDNIFKVIIELDDSCVNDNIHMMFRLALCTGEICFMKIFALDFALHREKDKVVSYDIFTENTLIAIDNNEMKVISSMATMI